MALVTRSGALIARSAQLDRVLNEYAGCIGRDAAAYRNHAYRVLNLCVALASPDAEQLEKIGVAAACHDIGIWTDGTFDYLEPSVRVANSWLERIGRTSWSGDVAAMIREHHKITPYRGAAGPLVEAFRRADWIDVSRGALRYGVKRAFLRELGERWPDEGFHLRLVQLTLRRWAGHPLSPLPMLKW